MTCRRSGAASPPTSGCWRICSRRLNGADGAFDGVARVFSYRFLDGLPLMAVVMFSSSTEERDIVRNYSLGVNNYIRKSVDYDKFIKAAGTIGFTGSI